MDLESQPLSLCSLIEEVLDISTFNPAWKKPSVELIFEYTDCVDWIWGDPTRLRQILLNLVSNALKYGVSLSLSLRLPVHLDLHISFLSPRFTNEGEVHVTLTYDPGNNNAVLTVRDTGIGMSDSMKAKLFQAFSQADSSVTRRYGGSGLGLAISKSLALLMGGELTCTASGLEVRTRWHISYLALFLLSRS